MAEKPNLFYRQLIDRFENLASNQNHNNSEIAVRAQEDCFGLSK